MRIDHPALWTDDPERLRGFHVEALGDTAGPRHGDPHHERAAPDPYGTRVEITV